MTKTSIFVFYILIFIHLCNMDSLLHNTKAYNMLVLQLQSLKADESKVESILQVNSII